MAWILIVGMLCGSFSYPQNVAAQTRIFASTERESQKTFGGVSDGTSDNISDSVSNNVSDNISNTMSDTSDNISGNISGINPLYEDLVEMPDLSSGEGSNTGEETPAAGSSSPRARTARIANTFNTLSQAGTYLRNQMRNRVTVVSLVFRTSETNVPVNEIFSEALLHTVNPSEGDYLKWHWSNFNAEYNYNTNPSDGIYAYAITYKINYYTTAAQEAAVSSKIDSVLASLNLAGKSDYDKIKEIYDYICKHVVYDYANLNNTSHTLKYSAYAALINGTAVCQGYALLFYRMLRETGIDTRLIAGKGVTSTGAENHAWNVVNLGNRYYNVDSTWDASRLQNGLSYQYFLKGETSFGREHYRFADYRTETFVSAYPVSNTDYISTGIETHVHKYGKPTFQWDGAGQICVATFRCIAGDDEQKIPCYVVSNNLISDEKAGTVVYTAKAIFYGGMYIEEKTVKVKPDRTSLKATSAGHNKISLTWKPLPDVSGYVITRATSKNGKYKVIDTVDGTAWTYIDTGLKCNKTYYYKVRAYNTLGEKNYYGTYSKIKSAKPVPASTTVNAAFNKKGKKVRLSWQKVSGASGYVIYRSTKKNGKYQAVKTITKNKTLTWTDTKTGKGKKYYYKVRAYKNVSGKRIYGAWSGVRKVVRRK